MTDSSNQAQGRMKIGVVLPIAGGEDDIFSYHQVRDLALQAESIGFDSLWIVDHLLFRFPDEPVQGVWESWSTLAALAEATSRVQLGTFVICTPFRNPALLAKMAVTVDAISEGRLILGLGAGWHEPEFSAFGVPFDHLVSRFEEALQIIVPLLREGQVDFQGRYYQARNCEILPRGPRRSGPPILIGAKRPRMLRLIARHAEMWNTCWYGQPTRLGEQRAAMTEACNDVGRDEATLETTVGVTVLAPGHDVESPNPDNELVGSVDEIAQAFRHYESLGVTHLVCRMGPFTSDSLRWLGEVLQSYRAQS